jgi:ABC-type lipoprotein export system ATPase subunit
MLLSFRNISKSFVQRGVVLDNLSLDVNEGASIAIMGPSGSGKTTLMNIAGLLDKADGGSILFMGMDIMQYTDNEAATYRNLNIGFVFQEHLLLPHLSVFDNIMLPLLAKRLTTEEFSAREEHIKTLMEKVNISCISAKHPFEISGGEAQRVALVRAMVNEPLLLLADEPTGSLDKKNATNLGTLLLDVNKNFGISILLATHSSELAGRMSVSYVLEDGKLSRL